MIRRRMNGQECRKLLFCFKRLLHFKPVNFYFFRSHGGKPPFFWRKMALPSVSRLFLGHIRGFKDRGGEHFLTNLIYFGGGAQ